MNSTSTVAYYLILLYVTVMLKPFIPVIADIWEHDYNEMEHITLVHAKYGRNHVQKEVAESSANDDQNKTNNILSSEDQVPSHILADGFNPEFSVRSGAIKFFPLRNCNFSSVIIIQKGPPPKFFITSI